MLHRIVLVAAALAAMSLPAAAQNCGNVPIPPAFATAAEIARLSPAQAQDAKHDAFVDIKKWQGDLKIYRDSVSARVVQSKARLADELRNAKSDKVKSLQGEVAVYNLCYDSTVDTEQRVVSEYLALQTAFCKRADVDRSTCPK